MFFALYGPRRDGHAYIPDLYQRGVRNFIIYNSLETKDYPNANFILVKDSLRALQSVAAFHRQLYDLPVVGITGSNGKTIVKEWPDGTADLEARYTLKTDDNVLIYIQNKGIRTGKPKVLARLAKGEKVNPSEYYMRTTATFEVAEGKYSWLDRKSVV